MGQTKLLLLAVIGPVMAMLAADHSSSGLSAAPAAGDVIADPTSAGPPTPAQLAHGARVYRTVCLACHMPDGKGVALLTPPLAGSDFLRADRERAIRIVLHGLAGPITVNDVPYDGTMPPLEAALTDRQVADVLTYVFNTWGNQGDAFAPEQVAVLRSEGM